MILTHLIDTLKKYQDYDKAGMILCHDGFVRSTSRGRSKVSGLRITVD